MEPPATRPVGRALSYPAAKIPIQNYSTQTAQRQPSAR
jgi:hypothetical protein